MLAMAQAFAEAGLPEGVLAVVTGNPSEISTYLIASARSSGRCRLPARPASGGRSRALPPTASSAPRWNSAAMRRCSCWMMADVEKAAATSAAFKFRNAGQVCIAPTRFYVHDKVHDAFVESLSAKGRCAEGGRRHVGRRADGAEWPIRVGPRPWKA